MNTPVTDAFSSPLFINLKFALLPSIKPSESIIIDLPVPVSPVKTDKPDLKSIFNSFINTMFLIKIFLAFIIEH